MLRSAGSFAFALAVALTGGASHAQSQSELALARQWFKEAETAERAQDYKAALEKFQKALVVKATPQILLHMGICQEKLGQLVQALLSYERAQEKAAGASLNDVASFAREQGDALRPRIPNVKIAPAESYGDLSVQLDGVALAASVVGDKLPLDPGDHKLVATASGRRPFELAFSVAERENREIVLRLAPKSATETGTPPPPPSPPPDTTKPPSKLPAYALIGGGAVAVGVGVALFFVAHGKDSAIDDQCGGPDRLACPKSQEDQIRSDISTVNTLETVSFIAGGVGIASAAVGAGLLVLSSKHRASPQALRIEPAIGTSGGRIVATGRF